MRWRTRSIRSARCHVLRLSARTLVASATVAVVVLGFGPSVGAQTVHQARLDVKTHSKHKGTSHHVQTRPCLEGNWVVTSLTLSTAGLSFTGGAGTTVDIMANGNAVGNFTPGTALTGSEGSAKFNGTITDHYGFSPKTTARSGSFSVTPVSNSATITVAGVTKPVTSEAGSGSYVCTGKDLSLTFTMGGGTLVYQLAPGS